MSGNDGLRDVREKLRAEATCIQAEIAQLQNTIHLKRDELARISRALFALDETSHPFQPRRGPGPTSDVIEALQAGPKTSRQVAEQTGHKTTTIREIMSRLKRRGHLLFDPNSRTYSLASHPQ